MDLDTLMNPKQHRTDHEIGRIVLYSAVVALGLFIGILIYLRTQSSPDVAVNTPAESTAATPDAFTDFYGTVDTASDASLTVAMVATNAQGQQVTRTYQVMIGTETVIEQISGDGTVTGLSLSDIQPNELLQVYGDQNLAELDSFTATRIIRISNNS